MTVTPPTVLPAPIVDGITPVNSASVTPNFEALRDGLNVHTHDEYATQAALDQIELTPGPIGPPGPPGAANASYTQTWSWTNKTADAGSNGQIGVNNADWALATQLNLSERTSDNTDVTVVLAKAKIGDELYVQQKTDATRWARYQITGAPVDQGSWWSFPVAFETGGGQTPGGNTAIVLSLLTQGGADLSTVPLLLPADDTRNVFSGPSGRLVITGKVTGDANNRFTLDTVGTMRWGPGSAGTDASLIYGSSSLSFSVANVNMTGGVNVSGRLTITRAAGSITIDSRATGNANPALSIDTTGKLSWGDGTNPVDTTLYRLNAVNLATSGGLYLGVTTQGILTLGSDGYILARLGSIPGAATFVSRLATGDSFDRFRLNSDGSQAWGPGTGAADAFLFRNGAGELRTTDTMLAIVRASSGTLALSTFVTADAQRRFNIAASGTHTWGDGASPTDTVLYRRGAKELGLSDTFLTVQRTNATDLAYRSLLSAGDTVARLSIDVNGTHAWGPGTGAADVTLSRNSPGYVLWTLTSGFEVSGGGYFLARGPNFYSGLLLQGSTATSVHAPRILFRDTQATVKSLYIGKTGDQIFAILDDGGNTRVSFDVGSANRPTILPGTLNLGGDGVSPGVISLGGSGYVSARAAAGASGVTFVSKVTGDAQDRFNLYASGQLNWGDGTAALDTILARIGTGVLGLGTSTLAGRLKVTTGSTAGVGLDCAVTTDAVSRFYIRGDGYHAWSDGTAVADTTLYRSASDTLKTDDTFWAVSGLGVGTAVDATAWASINTSSTKDHLAIGNGTQYLRLGLDAGSNPYIAANAKHVGSNVWNYVNVAGYGGNAARIVVSSAIGFYLASGGVDPITWSTVATFDASGLTFSSSRALILRGQAATSTLTLGMRLTGDTVDRFTINADGRHEWGPGNAVTDCILVRRQANDLGLTSTLLTSVPLTGANIAFSTLPSGFAARMFNILGSGNLQWGDGTLTVDTFLGRIGDATHLGLAVTSTRTLAAGAADSAALQIAPTVNGAFTLTRLNYIEAKQPAGTSTITDAAVVSFDAVAGTHKAVDAGSTKTTPGTVNAWLKVNIAGTIYYLPAYTSKTT